MFAALLRIPTLPSSSSSPSSPSSASASASASASTSGSASATGGDGSRTPRPTSDSPYASAFAAASAPSAADSLSSYPITALCESTGGRSELIRSLPALLRFMEYILHCSLTPAAPPPVLPVQPLPPPHPLQPPTASVVVQLSLGAAPASQQQQSLAALWVRGVSPVASPSRFLSPASSLAAAIEGTDSVKGRWPIPEPYLPTATSAVLPPRPTHPTLVVSSAEPVRARLIEGFAVDSYELEPVPSSASASATPALSGGGGSVVSRVLALREGEQFCRPCYVWNSMGDQTLGKPFGFVQVYTVLFIYLMPLSHPRLCCVVWCVYGTEQPLSHPFEAVRLPLQLPPALGTAGRAGHHSPPLTRRLMALSACAVPAFSARLLCSHFEKSAEKIWSVFGECVRPDFAVGAT